MRSEYDEDLELDRYVLNHFGHLMTDLERLGQKSVFAQEKASNQVSEKMKQVLLDKWGSLNNPEVVEALSGGVEQFRRTVRKRILKDHEESVFLNRCPKCTNLLETPRAQMCLWCNHSWHPSS